MDEIHQLENHLSRLTGKVSKITTKINSEGKKVKLIKISNNKKVNYDQHRGRLNEVLDGVRK